MMKIRRWWLVVGRWSSVVGRWSFGGESGDCGGNCDTIADFASDTEASDVSVFPND
jgi:hypothetical protein